MTENSSARQTKQAPAAEDLTPATAEWYWRLCRGYPACEPSAADELSDSLNAPFREMVRVAGFWWCLKCAVAKWD